MIRWQKEGKRKKGTNNLENQNRYRHYEETVQNTHTYIYICMPRAPNRSTHDNNNNNNEEEEQEEMFVDPYFTFEYSTAREWGGPTRGGRLPEPTRFGDWERKGRCSDF
mmetsp:Transcript_1776/g.2385  ORF Transcript_1776/g.2385 Transcript_1776/m.2385 type:complete len:109 (-) Transcript_1776:56-382(-)